MNFDKYDNINFQPPQNVRDNASSALKWIDKGCDAGTRIGKERANQLENGENLSPETIKRMVSFFARHSDNRGSGNDLDSNGCPSRGYIAWMLWGGDAGETWANKINRQMETVDEKFSKNKKEQMEETPVYELIVDEKDGQEVYAISLVDEPAIESNFLYFNKKGFQSFKKFNTEKRQLIGAVMIPDILIPRYDEETKTDYKVYFTKDTIEKVAHSFLEKKVDKFTEHHDKFIQGVKIVESWIVKNPKLDKSTEYGYNYPEGTWCSVVQIEDEEYFNEYIKTGKVKGFSVEGLFGFKPKVDLKNQIKSYNNKQTNFETVMNENVIKTFEALGFKYTGSDKEKMKVEDKEGMKKDEKEKMKVEEKVQVDMQEDMDVPEGSTVLELPNESRMVVKLDEPTEVELEDAEGNKFVLRVERVVEERTDPSETGEDVENPRSVVVDEFNKLKEDFSKLVEANENLSNEVKNLKNEAPKPANFAKVAEGSQKKTEGIDLEAVKASLKRK